MAVNNPFSIQYGSRTLGGTSDTYQLNGPYAFEKSFTSLSLVFDVVVVATDHATLHSLSDALETDLRLRDQNLVISVGGNTWTYTAGTHTLNVGARITKTGNPDTDKGNSRSYTVTIEAELPADDDAGLRDVQVLVDYEAGRQRIVTMRGVYTALSGTDAMAQYQAQFDTEATAYLDFIDATPTWELVDESFEIDRNTDPDGKFPHLCRFTRQYVELLADQATGVRDNAQIKDHRVRFTDFSTHPAASRENVYQLRRVEASFECAIDITQASDLSAVFESTVRPYIVAEFQAEYSPSVFAIEDRRVSYDETAKRMSVAFVFLYQAAGGGSVIQISQSVAYQESRALNFVRVHSQEEHAAYVHPGWAELRRVWERTVTVVGEDTPKLRILSRPVAGDAGLFTDNLGGINGPDLGSRQPVQSDGWNIESSVSRVSPGWIGDVSQGDSQIRVTTLTETVVEVFTVRPGNRTATPFNNGGAPITQ